MEEKTMNKRQLRMFLGLSGGIMIGGGITAVVAGALNSYVYHDVFTGVISGVLGILMTGIGFMFQKIEPENRSKCS